MIVQLFIAYIFVVFEDAIKDYHRTRRTGVTYRELNRQAEFTSIRGCATPQSCQSSTSTLSRTDTLTSESYSQQTFTNEDFMQQSQEEDYSIVEKQCRAAPLDRKPMTSVGDDEYSDDLQENEEETQRFDGHRFPDDEVAISAEVAIRMKSNGVEDPYSIPKDVRSSSAKFTNLLSKQSMIRDQVISDLRGADASKLSSSSSSSSANGVKMPLQSMISDEVPSNSLANVLSRNSKSSGKKVKVSEKRIPVSESFWI
jgi:hypothetical protein